MKKIVTVVLVLLVLLVAAPWAIGRLAESRVNAGLDRFVAEAPYLTIVERKWTGGWFRSEQEVTFEVFGAWLDAMNPKKVLEDMQQSVEADAAAEEDGTPAVEAEEGRLPEAAPGATPETGTNPTGRIRFTVRNEILHGPVLWPASLGLARVNTRFALSDKLRAELIEVFGTDEPVRISHRVGFFGGGSTRFFAEGRSLDFGAEGTLVYDDLDMTVDYSGDFDDFEMDGSWPKVEMSKPNGEQMVLRGISLEGESERIVGDVYDTDAEFEIASMTFIGADKIQTDIDDVRYAIDTEHRGDFLDLEARFGSGKISNPGLAELQLELKEIHYDFTFRHLHVETLNQLTGALKASYTKPVASIADVDSAILAPLKEHGLALLRHQPEFAIDRIGLVTPEGEGVIKGVVRLEGVTDADFPPGMALLDKLVADLTIEVANALLEKLPNGATGAGMAVDQGFAKREGDKLVSRIEFRKGTLTVNGQNVPIPGFGAPPPGAESLPEEGGEPEQPEE